MHFTIDFTGIIKCCELLKSGHTCFVAAGYTCSALHVKCIAWGLKKAIHLPKVSTYQNSV